MNSDLRRVWSILSFVSHISLVQLRKTMNISHSMFDVLAEI
jgi:hypothetical protein